MAPPENPYFNSLSQELFGDVMLNVRKVHGVSPLAACLLVCKGWRDSVLPLLYMDVFIGTSNIGIFNDRVTRPNCSWTKSLTVSIKLDLFSKTASARGPTASIEEWEETARHGSPEAKQLWNDLENLSEKVKHMTNLSIFSFSSFEGSYPHGFWISRQSLASLINSLAETCQSVEIDTRGQDHSSPGSNHLCDSLRRIFPRAKHVKLRLSTLCSDMFSSASPDAKGAIDALFLQTVVINFVSRRAAKIGTILCDTSGGGIHASDATGLSAHVPFVQYMQGLLETGKCPEIKRMLLVDSRSDDYDDKSVYPAFYQHDVVNNVTYSLPYYKILPFNDDSYLMRIYPEDELVSYYWALVALAEGETWKSTTNGFRFPSALLQSESLGARHILEELPVMSIETWKEKNPKKSCFLWRNEKMTGMRLLSAERHDGVLETPIAREHTPAGWIRDGTDIEPAED